MPRVLVSGAEKLSTMIDISCWGVYQITTDIIIEERTSNNQRGSDAIEW